MTHGQAQSSSRTRSRSDTPRSPMTTEERRSACASTLKKHLSRTAAGPTIRLSSRTTPTEGRSSASTSAPSQWIRWSLYRPGGTTTGSVTPSGPSPTRPARITTSPRDGSNQTVVASAKAALRSTMRRSTPDDRSSNGVGTIEARSPRTMAPMPVTRTKPSWEALASTRKQSSARSKRSDVALRTTSQPPWRREGRRRVPSTDGGWKTRERSSTAFGSVTRWASYARSIRASTSASSVRTPTWRSPTRNVVNPIQTGSIRGPHGSPGRMRYRGFIGSDHPHLWSQAPPSRATAGKTVRSAPRPRFLRYRTRRPRPPQAQLRTLGSKTQARAVIRSGRAGAHGRSLRRRARPRPRHRPTTLRLCGPIAGCRRRSPCGA